MNFKNLIKSAFINIKANLLRSSLTLLGIVIGIAAVMVVIGFGEGNRKLIMREIEKTGADILWVQSQPRSELFKENVIIPEDRLGNISFTWDDFAAVKALCPAIKEIAPVINDQQLIKYQNKNEYYSLLGTTPAYQPIHRVTLLEGRFLTDFDVESRQNVCVIEKSPNFREIFGLNYPVGKELIISGMKFEIVGMVDEKREGENYSRGKLYLPITALQRIKYPPIITRFYAQAKSSLLLKKAASQIESVLRSRHLKDNFTFQINTLIEIFQSAQKINKATTLVITGIAGISLLVGGIGIMNIMLVSITERTREIGLRRAIGATKRDISLLFLAEAIALCCAGGILGVFIGWVIIILTAPLFNLPVAIPFWGIFASVCSAIIVGLISGIYPALKAGNLNPIEALRYE